MKTTIAVSIACCIFLMSPLLHAGTLRGKVINATTKQPLAGANLILHVVVPDSIAIPATSDQEGNFVVENVPPGNSIYALNCSQSGYVGFTVRLDDVGVGDHVYNVELEPEASSPPPPGGDSTLVIGVVQGRANDGNIVPVGGSQITITSNAGQTVILADAEGRFTLRAANGIYQFELTATGFVGRTIGQLDISGSKIKIAGVLSPALADVPPSQLPTSLRLYDAFPNPFNPSTTVVFSIPKEQQIRVIVFNALGQEIRTLFQGIAAAGEHKVRFDASGLPSGMYFYRLISENEAMLTKKMILMK